MEKGIRNKIMALLLGSIIILALLPANGFCTVPQRISYQGELTDNAGNPLDDDYVMVFSIYNVSSGGSPIWWEEQTVTVTNGIFNVLIGETVATNPFPDNLFDGDRWLCVSVGADPEMTPRQQLASTAFAMRAKVADSIADGGVTNVMIANGAVDSEKIADNSIGYTEIATGAVRSDEILTNAVGPDEIAAGAVGAVEIAANAVGTSEIADGSVYYFDLADGAALAEIADNDGPGSGLDADTVDGEHASDFAPTAHTHSATQITSGTLSTARYSARSDLSSEGYLGNASGDIAQNNGTLQSTLNADLLDGLSSSAFMAASTDRWVNVTGDAMSGSSSSAMLSVINTNTGSVSGVHSRAEGSGAVTNYGGYFLASGQTGRGVYGRSLNASGRNYGGYFEASGDDGRGVYGKGQNRGAYFIASGATGQAIYGKAIATGSNTNYGGYFEAAGDSGIGIYAIGGSSGYAGDFRGNILIRSRSTGASVIELGEGLDYAEGFDISEKIDVVPGSVLIIDPDHPGKLKLSDSPYDTKVAGIVAGGKNLGSGVRLGAGQFDYDVALAGRVYCNVDANYGKVSPGDLLTSSPNPGYAMKVNDYIKAQGAILGKAMQRLEKGQKEQILVLVTLQ